MKITKIMLIAIVTSLFAFAATAHADKKDKSPEGKAAKYRHNTFNMVGYHFGPMGGMMKGKIDFNKDVFAKNAEALALLAYLAPNGFALESKGKVKGSRAKKDIWENKAEFDKVMKGFTDSTAALAKASKSGDMAAIKPVFANVADSCKTCHKKYRAKKKK